MATLTTPEASPLAAAHAPAACPPQERTTLAATIIDFDGGVVVRVEGEAGIVGLEKLEFAFARVIARRAPVAVLDLSHLTFVSSLAIGQLLRLRRDLNRWNGRVKIASCPPTIHEVLQTAGLVDFFGFHASVEEALSAS
jgi:anti-anti-sigma factor